jgi:hypothetical protein
MTKYNLVIAQGKTFKRTWLFRSTVLLSQDLVPDTVFPPTSISVLPLTHPVASGTILKFPIKGSCLTTNLITSAPALPGDTTISILPYTGTLKLPCKTSIAPNDVVPLNDIALVRGQIRGLYADAAPLLTFTFSVLPLQGIIEQLASAASTALLVPNCIFSDVPAFPQDDLAWDKSVFRRAYFWDAEIVRNSGDVDEFLEGRCWIKAEATK